MSKKKTIVVEFTTDEEAGAVYGTLRKLQRDDFIQSYNMYNDHALFSVRDADVDTALYIFHNLSTERGLPGILAKTD